MWGATAYKTTNPVQYMYIDSVDDIFGNGNDIIYDNSYDTIVFALGNSYCQSSCKENSDINILNDGTYFQRSDYHCNFLYNGTTSQVIVPASNFFSPTYQLTVNLNPSAGGTVTSSSGSLTCTNGVCTGSFSGDVQLTASAADGWEFVYWIDGGNNDTTNPKTVSMTAAKEMKAVFKLLSFPLTSYNAYNAPVSSVFDHSGTAQYEDTDHQVKTFKGETSEIQTPYSGTTCYPKSDNSAFGLGFNYDGISGAGVYYLCYNGHPGYDYKVANNTPVYAATDGVAHLPSSFPGVQNAQNYNTVEIERQDGYKTYYLHLSSQNVTENQPVYRGQTAIGHSGDTGSPGSYHLHFEVQKDGIPVDPYGWEGSGNDPYTRDTNYNLWR